MNWMSDLEVRITAQTAEDVRDLRSVMNPQYGTKAIVIEACKLRLVDTTGMEGDYYGEPLAAEENEKQLERNRVLKERLEKITKGAKNDTLHG